jgi:hypothetical protein
MTERRILKSILLFLTNSKIGYLKLNTHVDKNVSRGNIIVYLERDAK